MERLNIISSSQDWRGQILSNLAATPFIFGGYCFECVEAPLQGIKISDVELREKVFKMKGKQALRTVREIIGGGEPSVSQSVYWGDEVLRYNSREHRMLIATFIHEKIRQNSRVQEALLSTNDVFIHHNAGKESEYTSLPERFFIEILLAERTLLKKLHELSL